MGLIEFCLQQAQQEKYKSNVKVKKNIVASEVLEALEKINDSHPMGCYSIFF
jgi:hypothetical protein